MSPQPAQLWEILYVSADEAGVPLRGARVLRKASGIVVQCLDYRKTMPQRIVAELPSESWDCAVLAAMRYAEAGGEGILPDPKQTRFFE